MKRKGNLSEELYNMRKLMNFNSEKFKSETTSLDRLVEEKMIEKYLLNEQVSQTIEKDTEVLLPTEDEEKKFGANIIGRITGSNGQEKYGEEGIKKSKERRDDLVGAYGDDYSKFITALSNYPANKHNWQYWYFHITQETRKTFLNEFVEWLNSSKKIMKIASKDFDKIEAHIEKGNIDIEKEIGEIPESPPQPFKFDLIGKNTFTDNISDISPEMQTMVDDFIKKITPDIQRTLESKKGVVTCDKIDIAASSSRFRNTKDAKDLTWAQLSEQRANKVYEEIYRRLSELGVKFKDNHKVLRGGLNGDGSSGPNPGKNGDGIQYTISKDGSSNNLLKKTPENINKLGDPHATKEEYDKYKFCIVEVVVSGIYIGDPDPYVNVIKSRDYSIEFKVSVDIGQPRKLGKFNTPIWTRPRSKGTPSLTKCPIFGGGENYGVK